MISKEKPNSSHAEKSQDGKPASLAENGTKLAELLQIAPIAIFEIDYKIRRFKSVNDAMCELTGYSREELLSMNPGDLLDAESVKRFNERVLQGLSGQKIDATVEYKMKAKDGHEIWTLLRVKPTYKKGKLYNAIVVGYDVTERKKGEELLRETETKLKNYATDLESLVKERTEKIVESEQSYRELYDSFGEAFIATDWELNVIHWNKAAEKITRVKTQDALGKKVYEVLPEMASVDAGPVLEKLQKKQPVRFMMNTRSRETGHQATFEVSTYPSSRGIIIIVEDKTEEENTKRLSAIGQTAGMVGHDIRNPLQSIVSDIYLLKSDLSKMPECATKDGVAESLENIDKNIGYINKIVQDLQDFANPPLPKFKETNVEDVFREVLIKKAIPEKIKSTYQIEPQASKIFIDPTLLKRILANLVNNAVQAMPNGGVIDLQACRKGGFFIITVQDTGTGIPDDIKPKLFTPLFTTKAKGQGLGLAAVKRITESLEGNITFESQEGKGTKFIIRLPTKSASS